MAMIANCLNEFGRSSKMNYNELALTLIDALGMSGQPVAELTLKFQVGKVPHVSVTLEIEDIDANTTLAGFHESLKNFKLVSLDEPDIQNIDIK
jgi:hypothetical protein